MDKIFFKFMLIAVVLWQLPIMVSAQKKYVSGKIITNIDTISGFILNNSSFTNKNQVVFSELSSGEYAKTYYPDQLTSFIADKKEYLSLPVSYNGKDNLYFIRRISFGYYNLYEGYENDGRKIFFLQTRPDEILYLLKELKREWLARYFSDCDFKHPRIFYDEISLTNLISKYSQCKQPENFVYQREKYKPGITLGLKMGPNISMMEFTDKINPYRGISLYFRIMGTRRLVQV